MSGMGERFDVPSYPIFVKPRPRTIDFNIPVTLSWELAGGNVISFQFVEYSWPLASNWHLNCLNTHKDLAPFSGFASSRR